MELKEPIFIVGTGRSGTTLLFEILAQHPQVAWLSKTCDIFPNKPFVSQLFLRAIDIPFAGKVLTSVLHPREWYSFWEYWCKGFGNPCRDLFANDVTTGNMDIRNTLSKIVTNKRNRMMLKITGWPRIGFLREIFPNAKFIHIVRDGRSVANSLISQKWWWGWRGPQNWRWGQLSETQMRLWEKYDKSFIALSAIEWMILMNSFEKAKKNLPDDKYFEVKYEKLCSSPTDVLKDITGFCNLPWSSKIVSYLEKHPLKNTNSKWKNELNQKQQLILQEILADYMVKYGYE